MSKLSRLFKLISVDLIAHNKSHNASDAYEQESPAGGQPSVNALQGNERLYSRSSRVVDREVSDAVRKLWCSAGHF